MTEPNKRSALRSPWLWAIMIVVIGLLTRAWLGHNDFDLKTDACIYLSCARSLASGEGYTYLGAPFHVRPPGVPYLASFLLRAFGEDFALLNWATSLVGILGAVLLQRFLRARMGDLLAFLLAIGLWFNPTYQEFCNQLMSDVPGLAAVLGGLLLNRRAEKSSSIGMQLLVGLYIGLSAYLRTACILLLPAILVSRVYRHVVLERGGLRLGRAKWAGMAAVLLGTVAMQLPWSIRNSNIEKESPAELVRLHSYMTGMFHVDPGDPESAALTAEEWQTRIEYQTNGLLSGLGSAMKEKSEGPWQTGAGILLLLATAYSFFRRGRASELLALASAVLIASYFGFRVRLVLPIFVIAVAALVECLNAGATARFGKRGHLVLCGIVAIAVGIGAGPAPERQKIHARQELAREIADVMRSSATPGANLAASRGYRFGVFLPENRVYPINHVQRREGAKGILRLLGEYNIQVCAIERNAMTLQGSLGGEVVRVIEGWRIIRSR